MALYCTVVSSTADMTMCRDCPAPQRTFDPVPSVTADDQMKAWKWVAHFELGLDHISETFPAPLNPIRRPLFSV